MRDAAATAHSPPRRAAPRPRAPQQRPAVVLVALLGQPPFALAVCCLARRGVEGGDAEPPARRHYVWFVRMSVSRLETCVCVAGGGRIQAECNHRGRPSRGCIPNPTIPLAPLSSAGPKRPPGAAERRARWSACDRFFYVYRNSALAKNTHADARTRKGCFGAVQTQYKSDRVPAGSAMPRWTDRARPLSRKGQKLRGRWWMKSPGAAESA